MNIDGERPPPLRDERPPDQPYTELAPEGQWPGVFVGYVPDPFPRVIHGESIMGVTCQWQIAPRRSDGRRHVVGRWYRPTLYRNSALRHLIEHWQGARITEWEAKHGIDLTTWWRRPALITVEHRPWRPGVPWVKVAQVDPWDYRDPRPPLTPEGYSRIYLGGPRPRPTAEN